MNLIIKLLIGIVAGILIGLMAPDSLVRLLVTFQSIISSFILSLIPFIMPPFQNLWVLGGSGNPPS